MKDIFEGYVERIPFSGCWFWVGGSAGGGYGLFKGESAHRKSYRIYRGSIPKGMCVLHTCDVPCCVNPDHLYIGTHAHNMRDRSVRGRNRGDRLKQEYCKRGHALAGDNLYIMPNDGRGRCRICKQLRDALRS